MNDFSWAYLLYEKWITQLHEQSCDGNCIQAARTLAKIAEKNEEYYNTSISRNTVLEALRKTKADVCGNTKGRISSPMQEKILKQRLAWTNYFAGTEFTAEEVGFETMIYLRCPYCHIDTEYVDSSVVYGKSYGMIYRCPRCGAFVGTHKGTKIPLGTPANEELRKLRKDTHGIFDVIWQSGQMSRTQLYKKAAEAFNVKELHIGNLNLQGCLQLIEFAQKTIKELDEKRQGATA